MKCGLYYIFKKFDEALTGRSNMMFDYFLATCIDAGTYIQSSFVHSGSVIENREVEGTYAILASDCSFEKMVEHSKDSVFLANCLTNSQFHLEVIRKTDLKIALEWIRSRGFLNTCVYDLDNNYVLSLEDIYEAESEIPTERRSKLYRLLEAVSDDVCKMGIEWCKRNNRYIDNDYATLHQRKIFAHSLLCFCDFSSEEMCPSKTMGKVNDDVCWEYALLYDYGDKLHSDEVFLRTSYVGWKIKFFNDLKAVKSFIKANPDYSLYSLYKGFEKVPLKILSNKGTYLSLGEEVTVDLTE